MPTIVHGFDWPDRFVVGTIGQPGARAFYLQVRAGARVVSVGLEKQQAAVLAEKVDELLDELKAAEGRGNPVTIPTDTPAELLDDEPLDQPVAPEFRTGAISLGWDPSTAQVVIEAFPLIEDDGTEPADTEPGAGGGLDGFSFDPSADDPELAMLAEAVEPAELLRVRIPVGTARAFATRTLGIVRAGRPLCPRCGNPLDPEGHDCPAGDLW
ncbi:DUF3090 domain-containing protein [Frigoribacterium sp. CFBP 13712]|uniref:DUF3090 domain-containing protein n=1 Tax=Frigoribacterium sp. CFBP 13712 TaxID=2775309 RepID=UPI00177E5B8B|nr:DUF3090 domain-containing protein [Frigoribacterium sp. CFBP 13712]MBD8703886.1 DUF3090 domain-containing protein [Frigoribacterium sp. CFBP 13712]